MCKNVYIYKVILVENLNQTWYKKKKHKTKTFFHNPGLNDSSIFYNGHFSWETHIIYSCHNSLGLLVT